jgi:RimJ/RimL family protein N-acetyltransferase
MHPTAHPDPTEISARLCTVRTVANHRGDRAYALTPVIILEPSATHAAEIARICNEPLIYSMLFADLLGGRPYGEHDATRFLEWAEAGWEEGSHFVYVLVDPSGRIAGAVDIKSPSLSSAEIGYWLGVEHGGVMTHAVVAIGEIAHDAGFAELFGLVRPDNERSARVLERAGYIPNGDIERNGRTYRRYLRRLNE